MRGMLKASAGRKWGETTYVLYTCYTQMGRDGSSWVSSSGILPGVPQDVRVSSEVFLQVAGMSHVLDSGGARSWRPEAGRCLRCTETEL